MLINNKIRDLVAAIDAVKEHHEVEDSTVLELITAVRQSCKKAENQSRYAKYPTVDTDLNSYPMGMDGYAQAFDPLTEEADFYEAWERYGVVVGSKIVAAEKTESTISRVQQIMGEMSHGKCDLNKPETYGEIPKDDKGVPALSRGFFEIYHDDSLAQLRQAVRAYIHHAVIWGEAKLWTSFDRFGVKLAGHSESYALPLHVDQNPINNPGFKSIQGVLALTDCPTERGTLLAVPGSKKYFSEYEPMPSRGEYVQLDTNSTIAESFQKYAQAIPIKAGDLVTWDSRTTHANTKNISGEARLVAYLAAGPASDRNDLIYARAEALQTGLARYNHEALLRVSTKPRYTNPYLIAITRKPEKLNLLGKLLYGECSFRTI